jgi:adenosylhomocysteine nucleosidase
VGDIVIGQTVVYHDGEPRMFAETYPHLQQFSADAALVHAAEEACRQVGVTYLVGKIATGDQFVGDAATKNAIQAKCSPDCVEMEGAAVAHIAAKNDTPFVILRAMSDNADESAYETLVVKQFDIGEYCSTAAHISAALIAQLGARGNE